MAGGNSVRRVEREREELEPRAKKAGYRARGMSRPVVVLCLARGLVPHAVVFSWCGRVAHLPAWLHTLAPRAADPAREPRDEARDGPAPRLLAGATGPAGPITPGAQGACACAAAAAGRAWRSCARTADWLMTELRCCRCAMMEAGAEAPTESGQPGGGGSQHGGPGAATGGGRGGAPAVPRGGGGLRDAGDPLATNPGEQAAAPWAQPAAGLEVAARVYSVAKHA